MTTPRKIAVDLYSDETRNTASNSFTNNLNPIEGVKGLQLGRLSMIASPLQLNDQSQLMFFYYTSATLGGIQTLRCIRLLPSWYVPNAGYTAFVKNKYFNNVSELVAQLNLASASGGDSSSYNNNWIANDISFSYDTTTRKVSMTGTTASRYYSPACFDDPLVIATYNSADLKMYCFNAQAIKQPRAVGITLNQRLGFTYSQMTNAPFSSANSTITCGSLTRTPQLTTVATEADAFPILIPTQVVNVYCNMAYGQSSSNKRNLLCVVPIDSQPLNIINYIANSLKSIPTTSTSLTSITLSFTDDYDEPIIMPLNYNVNAEIILWY